MAAIGDVLVKFVADFAEFSTNMQKSQKQIEDWAQSIEKAGQSVQGFVALAKRAFTAVGVAELAREALQYGEALQKNAVDVANLAQRYKLTTDQIQALQQIAKQTGQSFDELAKIGQQNADWLAKVTENAKAAGDIIGGETVQKFKAMADASDEAHHKLEVLFAPLYANVKSTVLSTIANELTRINGILDAFNISTLEKIILITNPITGSMVAAGAVGNALFGGGLTAGEAVASQLDKVNGQIAQTVNELAKLREGGPNVWAGDIQLSEQKLQGLYKEVERLRNLQKTPVLPPITVTPELKPTGGGGGGGGRTDDQSVQAQIDRYNALAKSAATAYATINAGQNQNIEDLKRSVTVQQQVDDIWGKLSAKYQDAHKEQKAQLYDAISGAEQQRAATQKLLDVNIAAVETDKKYGDGKVSLAKLQKDLNDQLKTGRINQDDYNRATKEGTEAITQSALAARRYDDNLGSLAAGFEHAANAYQRSNDMYSLGEQAFNGLTSSMMEGLKALEGQSSKSFQQIAADFANLLAQMALQAAASAAFKAIFGAISGPTFSGVGSINAANISAGLPTIPGLAGGGPVSPGSTYLVGEQGPEYFVPTAAGNIVPMGQQSSGGVTVNVDMSGGGGTDPNQAVEFARRVKQAVVGVINNEKRPGGTLYQRQSA